MVRRLLRKWASIGALVLIGGLVFLNDGVLSEPQFSAMFVFGDSLIDNGNNNFINSQAKANFWPYGIDFFQGPTGRFTNGKTCIDFLAELIGLPYLPPYAIPFAVGRDIINGVNFASAAGGILEQSGQALGERFSFSRQVENFGITKRQLQNQLSDTDLQHYLEKALAVLILGSNDYINNYLIPSYGSRAKYKPEQFADLLITHYTKHLMALHDQGLRRFFVAGVPALGCSPAQRTVARVPAGKCVNFSNDVAQMFNTRLKTLVDQLNATHVNATFIYGDTFKAFMEILGHSSKYGLSVVNEACCGSGRNRAEKTCFPLSIPCTNREQYAFWDGYHPTQAVHRVLALMAYNGPDSLSYPINLHQMAHI